MIVRADVRRGIPLASASVHCCVTSPPYWGLRDYGTPGQIGLDRTPEEYVDRLVAVFREVRRVLRPEGVLWLNIGDCYATGAGSARSPGGKCFGKANEAVDSGAFPLCQPNRMPLPGLKAKDLVGVPWMLAFALRADGWYLRQEVVWSKRNCMPESVRDRPTRAHEQVFLLTKQKTYFYDADAIREPHQMKPQRRPSGRPEDETPRPGQPKQTWSTAARDEVGVDGHPLGRNVRSVWSIPTTPFKGSHFATMPIALAERCIMAGTSERGVCPACGIPWRRVVEATGAVNRRQRVDVGDFFPEKGGNPSGIRSLSGATYQPQRRATDRWRSACSCDAGDPVPAIVFDPFGGAMTTTLAARRLGRVGIATELSAEYAAIGAARLRGSMYDTAGHAAKDEPLPLFG